MKRKYPGKRKTGNTVDVLIILVMILLAAVMVYPLLYVLASSFSSPQALARGEVVLFPVGPTLQGYQVVLSSSSILSAYRNSITYAILHTLFAVFICSFTAYPLSISTFSGRKFFMVMLSITMFFGGGLIPTFLVIRSLGMYDTIWAVTVPAAFGTWYVIITRANYQSIPASLRESAYLDGANDVVIWFKIYLPLSKAILATVSLFAMVANWNNFFTPFIYLTDQSKFPLPIILRQILIQNQPSQAGLYRQVDSTENLLPDGVVKLMQHCTTIVAIGPIILVYPFIQKYFTKGVLVGSLKG